MSFNLYKFKKIGTPSHNLYFTLIFLESYHHPLQQADINGAEDELLVRSKAEDSKNSWLVLEQWIFFLVSGEEQGLCMTEENIQAFASDHDPRAVFYWFVFLVFFVHQKGDHSDEYGQAAKGDQDTICHS